MQSILSGVPEAHEPPQAVKECSIMFQPNIERVTWEAIAAIMTFSTCPGTDRGGV